MANGKGFAFFAGAFIGTVVSYLAFTEKGKEVREDVKLKGVQIFEDSRAAILNKLDKIEAKLEGGCNEWEDEDEFEFGDGDEEEVDEDAE